MRGMQKLSQPKENQASFVHTQRSAKRLVLDQEYETYPMSLSQETHDTW